jgi:DNA (cytosine-5)-methyltransferase 1
MKQAFTFIDLFAGIGGFHKALLNNGGFCKGYSEINKDAIETYCKNHNEKPENNLGSITQIKSLPKHDILTAGVPCQSWSIAGKNLGFDDDRGQLWNDTIYLLKQSQPKAFIFENVKGLADPRNKEALKYIMDRIKQAGYYANFHLINSYDYGVAQNRIRVYIIGFRDKQYFDVFKLPKPLDKKIKLADILGVQSQKDIKTIKNLDLFGNEIKAKNMSLSHTNGVNDYFLFNDLRNGDTTIHSWDIIDTTVRQKEICMLLLKNRRKSAYGRLDGNPLSLEHFQSLDESIKIEELEALIALDIFKKITTIFSITNKDTSDLTIEEKEILKCESNGSLSIDILRTHRPLKQQKINFSKVLISLKEKNMIKDYEYRYEFKNSKISTGLFGINRVFLPSSNIFPTLVASDSNDYIAVKNIGHSKQYKKDFLAEIYDKKNYRKITKEEACLIQGFPKDFKLPATRPRWMKLIGNSVSIPVIEVLSQAMLDTGLIQEIF